MPKTADQIFQDKIAFILKAEERLKGAVKEQQQRLYDLILAEYLPLFEVEGGLILDSSANTALLYKIETLFNRLEKAMERDVLGLFSKDLLKSAEMSAEYYVAMGFEKKVVSKLLRDKIQLEKRIGVTATGRLRKNGYLYKLGKTEKVRQELLSYVISNLTGDTSFLDFQLGFRNLVLGNRKKKGLSTSSAMSRYFDQFAYDTYGQMDAVVNNQFAAQLNLTHLMYVGSLIDTSRQVCEDRAGKVFKVSDTKKWKDDPHLIDKKTKASYRPLIDRGRNRCRHFIKYITEELYKTLVKRQNA